MVSGLCGKKVANDSSSAIAAGAVSVKAAAKAVAIRILANFIISSWSMVECFWMSRAQTRGGDRGRAGNFRRSNDGGGRCRWRNGCQGLWRLRRMVQIMSGLACNQRDLFRKEPFTNADAVKRKTRASGRDHCPCAAQRQGTGH
jgi:hypothetical protein